METNQQSGSSSFGFYLFAFLGALGVLLCYNFDFWLALFFLPALWAAAAFRSKNPPVVLGLLSAFSVIYGLLVGYDILFSLRILLLCAPAPVLLYLCHRFRLGNTMAALTAAPAIAFALFAVLCFNSLHAGKGAYYEVNLLISASISAILSYFPELSALTGPLASIADQISDFFPAFCYRWGAAYALTNVVLLQLMNRRKHLMPLVPIRKDGNWSLPRKYVVVCLIVMLGSMMPVLFGLSKTAAVMQLSGSMLNLPLSFVGAGALYQLLTARRNTAGRKWLFVLLIAVLLFIGVGIYLLASFGLFKSLSVRRQDRQQ